MKFTLFLFYAYLMLGVEYNEVSAPLFHASTLAIAGIWLNHKYKVVKRDNNKDG